MSLITYNTKKYEFNLLIIMYNFFGVMKSQKALF